MLIRTALTQLGGFLVMKHAIFGVKPHVNHENSSDIILT